MANYRFLLAFPQFALLTFLACGVGLPLHAAVSAQEQRTKMNDGLFLLHYVLDQEKDLDLILIVKSTPDSVGTFVKHIAQTAKDDLALLDRMQAGDRYLTRDHNPLPALEIEAREGIKADKQHLLLFGTTGRAYGRLLLVTQIEAGNYMVNLTKAMTSGEKDPDRVKTLLHISAQWGAIRDQSLHLLGTLGDER